MAAVQAHGRSVRDDWLRTRWRQQRAGQSARPGGAVGTRRPREPRVDSESPTQAAGAGGKWGAEGWLHAGATTGRLEWPRHHTGPLGRSGRPFQPPRNTRGLSSPRHRRRRGVTKVRQTATAMQLGAGSLAADPPLTRMAPGMLTHASTRKHTQAHTCTQHTHMYTCTHTHKCPRACTHAHTCTHVHAHTHMCTHACTHTRLEKPGKVPTAGVSGLCCRVLFIFLFKFPQAPRGIPEFSDQESESPGRVWSHLARRPAEALRRATSRAFHPRG